MNMNAIFSRIDAISAVTDYNTEEAMHVAYIRRMAAKRRQMRRLTAREIKERLRNGLCTA